jgi:hypothetical protein
VTLNASLYVDADVGYHMFQALVGTGPMGSDTLLDWIDEVKKRSF